MTPPGAIFYAATIFLSGKRAAFFLAGSIFLFIVEVLHPSSPEFRRSAQLALLAGSLGLSFLKGKPGAFSRRSVALALGASLSPTDRLLNLWELLQRGGLGPNPFLQREISALSPELPSLRPSRLLRPTRWGKGPFSRGAPSDRPVLFGLFPVRRPFRVAPGPVALGSGNFLGRLCLPGTGGCPSGRTSP